MVWLHGLISGNHKHATAFTLQFVCSYECMLYARLQSTVIRNTERSDVRTSSVSEEALPKPSAWSGAFHLTDVFSRM